MVVPGEEAKLWNEINRIANYLKHVDKYRQDQLNEFNETVPEAIILFDCFYYYELEGKLSPEMAAFVKWMALSESALSHMYNVNEAALDVAQFRSLLKEYFGSIIARAT